MKLMCQHCQVKKSRHQTGRNSKGTQIVGRICEVAEARYSFP